MSDTHLTGTPAPQPSASQRAHTLMTKVIGFAMYGPEGPKSIQPGFAGELEDITATRSVVLSNVLLATIALFFVIALLWAAISPLDEVVRGDGKIVPSSEIKRIQNFEGGIVQEILVHEGQQVTKGQVLIKLDPTQLASRFREQQSGHLDQMAAIARLEAELAGSQTITFPEEVIKQKPALVESQKQLLLSREESRRSSLAALQRDQEQKQQALREAKSKLDYLIKNIELLKKEADMIRPMVAKGAAAEMDLLRVQRQLTELAGQIAEARLSVPKAAAAVEGAAERLNMEKSNQRSELMKELNQIRTEYEGRQEKLPALEDQVDRTNVRSPVDGTVKRVFVTTIGEAVGAGKEMVEIVPKEDTLLVEAKVQPRDIAFLYPGQTAEVKITAYDYSIYGGMEGTVEHISADAITDERDPQRQSYYIIKIRTKTSTLRSPDGTDLPIIPGMVAEADVLTGKKTVLKYLLKPITKTAGTAMRER